jgi:DNA segregation ATPase FtsK/SpoIIIE-like protein
LSNIVQSVPYGYEPPAEEERGTLIYYDTFEQTLDEELDAAVETAHDRSFAKFVLYPIHEETMRRMSKSPVSAYYKREKRLYEWKQGQVAIDGWEGKRKKYTPLDSALRHLTETLPAPHFLYLTPEMANLLASFSSFEEWIVKMRLVLSSEPTVLHPRLEKFRNRWGIR